MTLAPAGATLSKFLDDCDDAAFLNFVNKAENEKFIKGFVNHKMTDDEIQDVGALLAELKSQNISNSKIEKWLERSADIGTFKNKMKLADDFEKASNAAIKNNSNPPCNAWGGNGARKPYTQLQVGDPKVIMDDALVDPNFIGTFGPASNPKKIYKAIYHDSKLTKNAPWTDNQYSQIIEKFEKNTGVLTDANGAKYLELEVKNLTKTLDEVGGNFLKQGDKIRIYKTDIYKSVSSGDGKSITETIQVFK